MVLASKSKRIKGTALPANLVFEEIDGRALPYKGFREVLANRKQVEEIVGSSELQSFIVSLIYGFLFNKVDRKRFLLLTNEPGLHISKGTNLANDIAIYPKINPKHSLAKTYSRNPPKIAIAVDVKIELDEETYVGQHDYVLHKSQKLIDFGTEKIVWILTESRKIVVIQAETPRQTLDFDSDIPLVDDCILNLAQLLKDEGVDF